MRYLLFSYNILYSLSHLNVSESNPLFFFFFFIFLHPLDFNSLTCAKCSSSHSTPSSCHASNSIQSLPLNILLILSCIWLKLGIHIPCFRTKSLLMNIGLILDFMMISTFATVCVLWSESWVSYKFSITLSHDSSANASVPPLILQYV